MAIIPFEKLNQSASNIFPIELRVVPGAGPGAVRTITFGIAAADITYELLTPVAWNGTNYVVWSYLTGVYVANTVEVISGFVWINPVEAKLAGEVVGNMLAIGQVDARDVVLPAGEVQGELEDALREASLRMKNLQITSLTGRRG